MTEALKISFQEAWDSSVVFFVDEELEREIEARLEALLETAETHDVSDTADIVADITDFLRQRGDALNVVLNDTGLSQEKFKRIISLLRKLGRIPGGFISEGGMPKGKRRIAREPHFARTMAEQLVDGKRDEELGNAFPATIWTCSTIVKSRTAYKPPGAYV